MSQKREKRPLFSRFSLAWTRAFSTSVFARFLGLYDRLNEAFENGALKRFTALTQTQKPHILRAKVSVAGAFQNSVFVRLWQAFCEFFLSMRLKSLGALCLTLGLSNCLVFLLRRFFPFFNDTADIANLFFGLALILASLPLFPRRRRISTTLSQSLFFGSFLSQVVLLRNAEYPNRHAHSADAFATLLGLLLGIVCIFINPFQLLFWITVGILGLLCLHKPEFGAAAFLFLFPFLSPVSLSLFSLFLCLAFLSKVLRGKRTLKMDLVSLAAILFVSFVFFSGLTSSLPGRENAFVFTLCSLSLFLFHNLARKREVLSILFASFVSGCALSALFAILNYVLPEEALFANLRPALALFSQNASPILYVLALPPALTILLRAPRTGMRSGAFFAIAALLFALWIHSALTTWIAAAFAAVLFFAACSRTLFFLSSLFGIALIVALPLFESTHSAFFFQALSARVPSVLFSQTELPASAFFLGLGAFTPDSLSSLQVSSAFLPGITFYSQLLLSVGLLGLLLLFGYLLFSFQKAANYFTNSPFNSARLLTISPIISAASLLVIGLSRNLLLQPHLFALLLILCAVSSSAVDTLKREDDVILNRF